MPQGDDGDPLARARAVVTLSVRLFTADPEVYRQVVSSQAAPLRHRPVELQVGALRRVIAWGLLDDALAPEALNRQVLVSYTGALHSWAAGFFSDRQFELQALHGLYSVLAAAATDQTRSGFLAELARLGQLYAPRTARGSLSQEEQA